MSRYALLAVISLALAVLVLVQWTASDPCAAAPCPRYPPPAHLADVKARVTALHRIEREAADRTAGLDTRPYEWLLEQARVAEKAISVPELVKAEDEILQRCFVTPLRTTCAVGSAALVRVIADLHAGRDTNEARMAYAQTMPHCERSVGLTALKTSLRDFKWSPQDTDTRHPDDRPARR